MPRDIQESAAASANVHDAGDPAALLDSQETYESVSAKIGGIVLDRRHPRAWWIGAGVAFLLFLGLLYGITVLFAYGVGVCGIDIPVAWGFAIVNFVWWIGIGHAGTLISAILLLLLQKWRNWLRYQASRYLDRQHEPRDSPDEQSDVYFCHLFLKERVQIFNKVNKERYMPAEVASTYWHFVDIVWIFVFSALYLIGP